MHRFRFIGIHRSGDFDKIHESIKDRLHDTGGLQDYWVLDQEESFHLGSILKLKCGDTVEVTDGAGNFEIGQIVYQSRKQVVVSSKGSSHMIKARSLVPKISIMIGALKPGSIEDILPGLVEIGVSSVMVFPQDGAAKWLLSEDKLNRWSKIIKEAVKQSKQNFLPEIKILGPVVKWNMESDFSSLNPCISRLILDDQAQMSLWSLLPRLRNLAQSATPDKEDLGPSVCFAVGSESGLTGSEIEHLVVQGWTPVHLGRNILRAKTAALLGAGLLAAGLHHDC